MNIKLLLFFSLLVVVKSNAQCGGPPPPAGLSYVYALDTDNDGYATFDMDYYITHIERPLQENGHGVSSSGYDFILKNISGTLLPLLYTNTVLNESVIIEFVYTGSGPTFDPEPPCYWPVLLASTVRLIPVPHDEDMDNDGILNEDEDTNNNLNLMDDDDDQDGIINLKDASNTLTTSDVFDFTLAIYPNPIVNGILVFKSTVPVKMVTVYDVCGKELAQLKPSSDSVNFENFASGIYFVKFQCDATRVFKKVIIR